MIKLYVKNGVLLRFFTDETNVKIRLPKEIEIIAPRAFYDCKGLTYVDVGEGVHTICSEAFLSCPNLKTLIVGPNVTRLEYEVVPDSPNLKYLSLPKNLQHLENAIRCFDDTPDAYKCVEEGGLYYVANLKDTSKLKKDYFIPLSSYFDHNQSACLSYVKYDEDEEYKYPTSYDILPGTKFIGVDGCFANQPNLTDITIPEGALGLGISCFYDCENLQRVTLPNSLQYIASSAFYGCDKLVTNNYKGGYYLGNDSNPYHALIKTDLDFSGAFSLHPDVKVLGAQAFEDSQLDSIVIPKGVVNIGTSCFASSKLSSITFQAGSKLTTIESSAFSNCYNLSTINIPDSVTVIGDSAFCDSGLQSVRLPKNLQIIESSAFYSCEQLVSVDIPDSVRIIRFLGFEGCIKLQNVNFGTNSKLVRIDYGAFGEDLLNGHNLIKQFTLPKDVCVLNRRAFGYNHDPIALKFDCLKFGWLINTADESYGTPLDWESWKKDFSITRDDINFLQAVQESDLCNPLAMDVLNLDNLVDGIYHVKDQSSVQPKAEQPKPQQESSHYERKTPRVATGLYKVVVFEQTSFHPGVYKVIQKYIDMTDKEVDMALKNTPFVLTYTDNFSEAITLYRAVADYGLRANWELNK